jgi:hypothetical protein
LFAEISQKVDGVRFSQFKQNACEKNDGKLISKYECQRLPLTPEAMAFLGQLQKTSEVPNEN